MTRAAGVLACALLLARAAAAQEPALLSVAAETDTVLVGEPFRAGVLLRAPAGSAVDLVLADPAERAVERVDSARAYPEGEGARRVVASFVVWTAEPPASVRAEARVTGADGRVRTLPVELPLPPVRATLPADSTEPRPPRDVLPLAAARALPWGWLALAAALLLLAGLAARAWRRRARPPAPPADPRAAALAALDALRAEGLAERGSLERFYARLSRIVRDFAAPEVGPELTTPEAVALLRRSGAHPAAVERLAALLAGADLAKFARRPPSPERAAADWEAARAWVAAGGPRAGEEAAA